MNILNNIGFGAFVFICILNSIYLYFIIDTMIQKKIIEKSEKIPKKELEKEKTKLRNITTDYLNELNSIDMSIIKDFDYHIKSIDIAISNVKTYNDIIKIIDRSVYMLEAYREAYNKKYHITLE